MAAFFGITTPRYQYVLDDLISRQRMVRQAERASSHTHSLTNTHSQTLTHTHTQTQTHKHTKHTKHTHKTHKHKTLTYMLSFRPWRIAKHMSRHRAPRPGSVHNKRTTQRPSQHRQQALMCSQDAWLFLLPPSCFPFFNLPCTHNAQTLFSLQWLYFFSSLIQSNCVCVCV